MKYENGYSNGLPYGWTEHTIINTMGFDRHAQIFTEVVEWIYNNVDNCEAHAHWFKINDCIYVQLRRRKDATMFALRWSAVA